MTWKPSATIQTAAPAPVHENTASKKMQKYNRQNGLNSLPIFVKINDLSKYTRDHFILLEFVLTIEAEHLENLQL